jgi:xanthine dehydrogenase YagT iron-sulfur-binding subunit
LRRIHHLQENTTMPAKLSRRDVLKGSSLAAGAISASAVASARGHSQAAAFKGQSMITSSIRINGARRIAAHEARVSLLDLLREQLKLTGTKKGCNEGACGACTVLLDGQRINACMTLAASCDGREVTTVEGLANADGTLNAVQQAFIDQDAFQCGYCTPGQVVSAVACIREGHTGSAAEIAEWMSGNICRCAGYPQILAAVEQAAKAIRG